MLESDPLSELRSLNAIASEDGAVLAFRVCEEADAFEPVFLRIFGAGVGEDRETALVSIDDQRGMSLGRYVVDRARLQAALEDATSIEQEDAAPQAVPLDWSP